MSQSNENPSFDPLTERGVHNPRMLDLIRFDEASNTVYLHMIEFRPWGSTEEQEDELQEKLNNYLDYVLDGHLVTQYPSYRGRGFGVILEYSSEPSTREMQLISTMERYLHSIGWKFQALARTSDQ